MDDFYAARSGPTPPLPWTNFVPPFSRQIGEKLQNLGAPQLPAANNYPIGSDTVDLKHPLREIATNRRNLCHPESSIDLAKRPDHRTSTLGGGRPQHQVTTAFAQDTAEAASTHWRAGGRPDPAQGTQARHADG